MNWSENQHQLILLTNILLLGQQIDQITTNQIIAHILDLTIIILSPTILTQNLTIAILSQTTLTQNLTIAILSPTILIQNLTTLSQNLTIVILNQIIATLSLKTIPINLITTTLSPIIIQNLQIEAPTITNPLTEALHLQPDLQVATKAATKAGPIEGENELN